MFRKLALIQQDKVKWLQDNDELEQFIEQKFETYAKNTILGRLDKVTDEEKAECESIVKDMLNVFAPFYKGEDEILLNAMEITKVQLEELENEQLSQSELDISQNQLKKNYNYFKKTEETLEKYNCLKLIKSKKFKNNKKI